MNILSAAELKRQLLSSDAEILAAQPSDWEMKKPDYAEVGRHISRMTGTAGWKIVETWLTRQLDINVILRGTDRDRVRAEAFADVLRQVNHWVAMGEKASQEIETKE